jgi:hypothetical protein
MADKNLVSTKKCPSCQQWSQWQQQATDRCEHCDELLDPRTHAEDQQQEATERLRGGIQLMEINPEDGGLTWFFKTIVRGGQLLFIAILAFIVWLVTALAA